MMLAGAGLASDTGTKKTLSSDTAQDTRLLWLMYALVCKYIALGLSNVIPVRHVSIRRALYGRGGESCPTKSQP